MDCVQKLLALKGREVSERRIKKYRSLCNTLIRLGGNLDKTLTKMPKVEALVLRIKRSNYQPETRASLFLAIKLLWKLANGHDLEDSPKEIRWIKARVSRSELKMPIPISDEDYQKMRPACNIRQKALISLLFEAGPRNSEICALKKSDVEFVKKGARIHIPSGTKTGPRAILVMDCAPDLAAWLANHPQKSHNAHLFAEGETIGIAAVQHMIKEIAGRAGVKRRIYTHLFRHTAATRCAKYMTEAELCVYFGWAQGSNMPARYVHLSGRDVDGAVLRMHNQAAPTVIENKQSPQACSRCDKTNMHDAKMCAYCGLPFDKEKAKLDDMKLQAEIDSLKKFREEVYRSRLLDAKNTREKRKAL